VTAETLDRPRAPVRSTAAAVRPVMLLTLNVPFDDEAVDFAVETAAQTGAELYICDAIPLEYRTYVGHVARQYAEQFNRRDLDAVTRRSRGRGVRTTQLAFHNPKPVKAAIEVAQSEGIGLLVFGPDRKELGKWSFRHAAKRIREKAPCLVWTNDES
jgi:nucleotide-binding universal stress UspA family protein